MSPPPRLARATAPALAALALLLFADTLGHGFVLDDTRLVRDRSELREPAALARLLTGDYWAPHRVSGLYRPVTTLSFALCAWIGGSGPLAQHAANVLLHAANTVLVLALFRRLGAGTALAGAGASLFAAHAVHSEAVANIAGRAELLCAALFLGALLCHTRPGGRARGASLAFYALALLSKENAVALLAVAPLVDLLRDPRPTRRERAQRYAALVAVTVLWGALRMAVLPAGGELPQPSRLDNPLIELDAPERIANALWLVQRYLGLLLLPLRLAYDHSRAQIPLLGSPAEPLALLAAALVLLELAAVALLWRRSRLAGWAAAFLFATLSVVSNVALPIGTIFGERLLYLPSVGFCLLAALALRCAARRVPVPRLSPGALFAALLAVGVGLHATRTVLRNRDWQSEERLYLADLPRSPGSARVQNNAGFARQLQGDHRQALVHFDRALEIEPRYRAAYRNAGISFAALGRHEQAIEVFRAELARGPDDAELHLRLANALTRAGRLEEARPHLAAAARLAGGPP